jgi:hypothetical protein
LGCLLSTFVIVFLLFIFGVGVGLPNTYWHRLGNVQVFEGPDRVVLFVEAQRAMRWPGFLREGPHNFAAAFLRIDVFPDGRVERTALQSELNGHITFNTYLYVAVRLADGFYLVEDSSSAQGPVYGLRPGQIDRLSPEEIIQARGEDVLRPSANMFTMSELDAVSAKRGWLRLNHEQGSGPYLLSGIPIESTRHGVRLRHAGGWRDVDAPESIVAESISSTNRWSRTLIEIDTRRWKSYRPPSDFAYLRARYAASPAW